MSSMMQPQIILLKEGTDTSQGKAQLISNINTCTGVSDVFRTTLGPRGMDKLIHDQNGNVTISNDGASIMKLLDTVHPAAKFLCDIAKSQDSEVGDGTATVVLLASEFLKEAKPFIEEGVHSQNIIRSYRTASNLAIEKVKELAVSIEGKSLEEKKSLLAKCAATTLSSKLIGGEKDFFASMVVDSVIAIGDEDRLNMIGIRKVPGGTMRDSFLVNGVAFKKTFSYAGLEQQPKMFLNPKLLLLNIELELKAEKENAEIRLSDPSQYQSIVDAEWNIIYDKLDKCVHSGAKVILSRLAIGDLATQYFADRDIFCAGRVAEEDLQRVAAATGGTVQTTVNNIIDEVLGTCETFEEKQVGNERFNILSGCPSGKTATIVLRGGADQFIEEAEQSLHDAIMIVRRALKNSTIVAGGGAIDMEISRYLRQHARTIAGKSQLFINSYAKALEIIPRQLCDNAGFDATDVLNKLRQKHALPSGEGSAYGVDINTGGIADSFASFVLEPAVVKINVMNAATEAACLILSMDETVKNPKVCVPIVVPSCSSNSWRAEEVIGGNEAALEALRELITFPLLYPQQAQTLGLNWPKGLLLYGPPGTGKTSLVRAVVRECNAHLTVISPHSVHKAYVGESERILREAFSEASSHAMLGKPSVIFMDEIDALCPRRDSRREQDVRLSSQLFTLMDATKSSSASSAHVVVVASTNRVNAIDPALRRSGRFDAEVEVTTPTERERFQILKLYTTKLESDPDVDLQAIAASCNGYVGADLEALCREATMSALSSQDASEDTGSLRLTVEDWKRARSIVGPSLTRGVTVEVPKVSWEDIGGLKDLKVKLQKAVEWPIKHSAAFSKLGISPVRGVLLHGPPGCSKTTLAKAAANAARASFFSLSGAELYSMYVGEGEALLRQTFQRARLAAPSIIFFDEADVIASKRGGHSSNSVTVGERLLSTLLTEMDGLEQSKGILVLAATNRPQAIDVALMRPGRFDLVLFVPPPDMEGRHEILQVHTRKMKMGDDVDLRRIAEDTDLFTGAELEGLCREAGIVALRENIFATVVCNQHFQTAKGSLKPALTQADVEMYSSFLKTQPKASSLRESGSKRNGKYKKFLLNPSLFSVNVIVLSLVILAAAKYLLSHTKSIGNALCAT